jgi:hypothetical protein
MQQDLTTQSILNLKFPPKWLWFPDTTTCLAYVLQDTTMITAAWRIQNCDSNSYTLQATRINEHYRLLGCNAVYSETHTATFRRQLMFPSAGNIPPVPPKCRYISDRLHGVISLKTLPFIVFAVINSVLIGARNNKSPHHVLSALQGPSHCSITSHQ